MRFFTASGMTQSSPRSASVRTVFVLAAGLALAAAISLPAGAPATPLADKQSQAAQLDREVGKLEDRYGDLQERWRGAIVELREIQADVADAQAKLKVARRDLRSAKVRLEDRAIAIYQEGGGGSSELLQVAQAGSLREFFDRIETIERVSDQDADILGRVRTAAERVQLQEQRLRTARDKQAKVVKRAATSKRKMKTVLTRKQATLNSVTGEIRAIMAQQRAVAEARDARAAKAAAATLRGGGTLEGATDTTDTGGA
ncbi:MAG: hypothetical protein JWM86_1434, partial [Thermoleophilia bacterium]|nr:hypothetical protein [Thermoleophilia bacterium]